VRSSRPDVSTTLSILGFAQAKPNEAHLQALKMVVRYLNIASEWKQLGASEQVLGWIRQGVRIPFIGGRQPPPFNSGTSMLNATKQQLDLMDSELPRFLQSGACEPGQRNIWVFR
jgi:hypothetical protein